MISLKLYELLNTMNYYDDNNCNEIKLLPFWNCFIIARFLIGTGFGMAGISYRAQIECLFKHFKNYMGTSQWLITLLKGKLTTGEFCLNIDMIRFSAHACATFFVRCYIRFRICWYYAKWPIRIKTGIIKAILRAKESNTIGQAYNCNKFVPSDFIFNSLNFRFQPIVLATLWKWK